jgi:hypothetical protein
MKLTKEQYAEVVAFDRERREYVRHRNGQKALNRRTIRYNYIVPVESKAKTLGEVFGYDKPKAKEVCIVNVAVRLDMNRVPVVKEVMWMYPETGWQEYQDMKYCRVAGWTVQWRSSETRSRRKRGKEPFRIGEPVRYQRYNMDFKHGRPGFNRTYDETVNPQALEGTRYQYCQYADDAPCHTGLMEWLSLYRAEPKVELLAKAGLHHFINPAGLKALKQKRIFQWAKDNVKMLGKHKFWPITHIVWAARHDTTPEKAREHFDRVHNMRYMLDDMRWHLKYPGNDRTGIKLKLDYERLARRMKKWHVDCYEYGRYIKHAFDAGLDLKNDGTLYPPTRGGRKAFMARLEELEKECARLKRIRERAEKKRRQAAAKAEKEWIAKTMKVRFKEIEAFQKSLKRTETLRGCGYTLVLAKTQKELRAEGRRMGNCVGNGTYGRGIIEGDRLIVMLRLGGKSYCDIEISRRTWGVMQCYLKGNTAAPRDVWELASEIAAFLKKEHRRFSKLGMFKTTTRKAA